MDSFTLNKIAGAILMVLLLTMGLGIVSDIIFEPEVPGQPGYEIVVASAEDSTSVVTPVPDVVPISELLLAASASDGERLARRCTACHTFEKDGPSRVGPNLWDIVGRAPAGVDGFNYSSAMSGYGDENAVWTYEGLNNFLERPSGYISGTSMGFAGLRSPEDRAAMIAYMREMSDTPKPLPGE